MRQYRSIAEFEAKAAPTAPETTLIAHCRAGEPCILGDGTRPETPDPTRTIRADLLRLLITGGSKECGLADDGVWLEGAWITGKLNLRFAKARGGTILDYCHFTQTPELVHARLKELSLEGSLLPGLEAQNMTVKGSVYLTSVTSHGTVNVNGVQIGGQLSCISASFDGEGGRSLNAQGVAIGESLLLRGLVAIGTVDLTGAQIGGQLSFNGAHFDGTKTENGRLATALQAQGLRVTHSLVWRAATVKHGLVNLTTAQVGDLIDDLNWPEGTDQLDLDGFTYDRITFAPAETARRLKWLKAGAVDRGTLSPQPYTQLAKVLSSMGHDRDARQVLAERERLLAIENRRNISRKPDGSQFLPFENPIRDAIRLWHLLIDFLLRWVVGYGYFPMRSLAWLAGLFLIATTFAHFTWTEGAFAPNSDVVLTSPAWTTLMAADCIGPLPATHPAPCIQNPADAWSAKDAPGMDWDSFSRYGYGADLVIPILDLGQTDAWAPSKDRGHWGWWLWWLRWVLSGAGWIVTGLGAAAVTGIIKRERG